MMIQSTDNLVDIDLVGVIRNIVGRQIGVKRLVRRCCVGERHELLNNRTSNRADVARRNDIAKKWNMGCGIVNCDSQRQQIGEIACSFLPVRNEPSLGKAFAYAGSFVAAKEEGFISTYRPAESASELVASQFRFRTSRKEVTSVEDVISKEFVSGAVQAVRS